MAIQILLGETPSEVFLDRYYLKLPFARTGGCAHLCHLVSWATVEELLAHADADVMIVRGGEHLRAPSATPLSIDAARSLHAEGYTLVFRHAELRHGELAGLAEEFFRDFGGPIDVHLYCTPDKQFGFGWHFDAEDVFILQSSGAKEYCLRKNTVHPWPVAEAMPKDMGYEKEIMPLLRCTLRAGDWLYIPAGYWHKAQSHDESISLAIGVMSPTSLDLLDYVRSHLASSLRWRQRLPPSGDVSPFSIEQLADQFQELGRDLGEDLARLLADRAIVLDYLASRGRATMPRVEN